jgi:hypothetical protein
MQNFLLKASGTRCFLAKNSMSLPGQVFGGIYSEGVKRNRDANVTMTEALPLDSPGGWARGFASPNAKSKRKTDSTGRIMFSFVYHP